MAHRQKNVNMPRTSLIFSRMTEEHTDFNNSAAWIIDYLDDNTNGNNPGHIWHDNSHSNQLVPAWLRGVSAILDAKMIDGYDPVHGDYIDPVDLGKVMLKSLK